MATHTINTVREKSKLIDLTGRRFCRLLVISRDPSKGGKPPYWLCQCDCGNQKIISGKSLKSGNTRSCGCLMIDFSSKLNFTHGASHSQEFRVWTDMRNRCNNLNNRRYASYGGRGITVSSEWADFTRFLADMGPRPTTAHQIDRIDNDGPYSKDNCKWSTVSEQGLNKRNTVFILHQGQKIPLVTVARQHGLHPSTLRARIKKYGWSLDKALSVPLQAGRWH